MYAYGSLYSEWFYHEIRYKPANKKLSAGAVEKASDLAGDMRRIRRISYAKSAGVFKIFKWTAWAIM